MKLAIINMNTHSWVVLFSLGVYSYTDSALETEKNNIGNVKNVLPDDDFDIVDIDSEPNKTSGNTDDIYEYYYVYYDEDGNIVNKTQTPTNLPIIKDKVQEIPLTTLQSDKPAIKNGIPSSSDEKPGDTPTIYAQIQNMDEHDENKKGEETATNDEGLTIFGIPIPKIPFPILSFGLTPTLSHGLLPIVCT